MINNKTIYEATTQDGQLCGKITPAEYSRFRDTARFLCKTSESLLDVGCFSGEWLNYITSHNRRLKKHMGIDVAQNKIDDGKKLFPHLNLRCLYAEELAACEEKFDTVTCLEVLEHIAEWQEVFHSLFMLANKQVIVTVPYREAIVSTPCIHCGKITPLYGHLRSYCEDDFPPMPGWERNVKRLRSKRKMALAVRIYRIFKPRRGWLLMDYRRVDH